MLGALRQQPIQIDLIDALGREYRFGDALCRILIEIDVGRAESQIESATTTSDLNSDDIAQATLWAMVEEPTPPLAPMKAIERPIGSASGSTKMPAMTTPTMSAIDTGAMTYSEMPERMSSR